MPSVTLHTKSTLKPEPGIENPLPQLLQTPSGLAILELQGTINTPEIPDTENDDSSASSSSQPVGRLIFPDYSKDDPPDSQAWMERVYLYVDQSL